MGASEPNGVKDVKIRTAELFVNVSRTPGAIRVGDSVQAFLCSMNDSGLALRNFAGYDSLTLSK
jgi:hypothetical protein